MGLRRQQRKYRTVQFIPINKFTICFFFYLYYSASEEILKQPVSEKKPTGRQWLQFNTGKPYSDSIWIYAYIDRQTMSRSPKCLIYELPWGG